MNVFLWKWTKTAQTERKKLAITSCFPDLSNYGHSPIFITSVWNNLVPDETPHTWREGGERKKKRGRISERSHACEKKETGPQNCSFLKRYTFFGKCQVFVFYILMQNFLECFGCFFKNYIEATKEYNCRKCLHCLKISIFELKLTYFRSDLSTEK